MGSTTAHSATLSTGPSRQGWSRYGLALKCLQAYAWRYVAGIELPPSPPQAIGTLGHVALAHMFERVRLSQGGEDWRSVPAPMVAVASRAAELHVDEGTVQLVGQILDAYPAQHEDYVIPEVISVEREYEFPIGGGLVVTRRADLVVRDAGHTVWIWDHKFQSRPGVEQYTLDGGFSLLRQIGQREWGRSGESSFGGVVVNTVTTVEPYRALVRNLPAAPAHDAAVLASLRWVIARIRELEVSGVPVESWPRAAHEGVCFGRYGPCGYWNLCRWGR